MSYCRWSSDNYESDLYVFHDVNGGWTTMIAGNRLKTGYLKKFNKALEDNLWEEASKYCIEHYLPLADQTFKDSTRKKCLKRLKKLKELGYRVPDHAIKRLQKEITESQS